MLCNFRRIRSALALSFAASTLLVAACAVPGRGGVVDDDDGSDDGSLTTTGSGTGSGGSGSGGATSSSSTSATTGSTSATTGSTTGSTGATTGGGSCPPANLQFNDPTCGSCVESACCSDLMACDGSTQCLDYLDCAAPCADQLCIDACDETYPTGSVQLTALNNCMDTGCTTECAAP